MADGYAKYRQQDNGEAHMWNYVQMKDNNWYGVDVTWNDPVTAGSSGAKSGHEHERYLLVGANTNVDGLVFGVSHPVTNRVADGGVAFANGPGLNGAAYDPNASQTVLHFIDVPASAWFASAVQYAYENGMMSGISANIFSPNDTTTRSMIVSILYRMEGEPATGASVFTDVPDGKWYSKAVSWAAENNIVSGYGNGRFGAEDTITREQMAVILYQYAAYKGYVLTAENNNLSIYADQAQIGGYALEAMRWAHGMGLITGTDKGLLLPRGSATRAQAASIFMRFCTSAA